MDAHRLLACRIQRHGEHAVTAFRHGSARNRNARGIVIVLDRAHTLAIRNGRIHWIAQVQRKGLVRLVDGVIHHRHTHRASRRAGGDGHRAVGGVEVGASCRAFGCGIGHRHVQTTDRAQRNGEDRSAIFADIHIVDHHARIAVIIDNGAGGRAVEQRRVDRPAQRHSEGLVRFVKRIVDNLNGDLLARLASRETEGTAGSRIVIDNGAAGRGGEVHGHLLAARGAQTDDKDRTAISQRGVVADGKCGLRIVVGDRARRRRGRDAGIHTTTEGDGKRLGILVNRIVHHVHRDRLGGFARQECQRAGRRGEIFAPGGADGSRIGNLNDLAADFAQRDSKGRILVLGRRHAGNRQGRLVVVVDDGSCRGAIHDCGVDRRCERQAKDLVRLVFRIVDRAYRDRLAGFARGEGQITACRQEVRARCRPR